MSIPPSEFSMSDDMEMESDGTPSGIDEEEVVVKSRHDTPVTI